MIIYVIQVWQSHFKYIERSTLHSKLMGTLPSKFLCHDEQIFHRAMKKKLFTVFLMAIICITNLWKKWALLFLFSLRIPFFFSLKTLNLKFFFVHWNYIFCIPDDFIKCCFFAMQIWSLNFFLLIYLDTGFEISFLALFYG